MRFDDQLSELTLADLIDRLGRGELSPVEVTEAALGRIDEHDPTLHAFTSVTRERALDEARRAEAELRAGERRGPLHGVPYAVKDLFDVEGEVTAAGSSLLADNVAAADAAAVARCADAGMVLVGKTHTVQFAFGGVGINHDTGTPHNPHFDEHYVPGGSSGGSAVAVAAGLVPIALGTDTSGSVRIPASLCGIAGLKTTVGRVSRHGVYPLSPTLDSVGPLARTVEGCALAYEVLQGADPRGQGDATTWGQAPHDVMSTLRDGVAGMRIGIVETLMFDDCDAEVESAVRAAGEVLESLGATISSFEVPDVATVLGGPDDPIRRANAVPAEGHYVNRRLIEEHLDRIDPVVRYRLAAGDSMTATDYLATLDEWRRASARALDALAGYDAWLAPTSIRPARPVAEVDADLDSYAAYNAAVLRNTGIGNRLGWCAVSVPCGTTDDGAPIGLMVHAGPDREQVALRVAAAYASAHLIGGEALHTGDR